MSLAFNLAQHHLSLLVLPFSALILNLFRAVAHKLLRLTLRRTLM